MAQPTVSPPIATRGSDFSPLLREIKAAGLLERRTAAYAMAIGINVVLMATDLGGDRRDRQLVAGAAARAPAGRS